MGQIKTIGIILFLGALYLGYASIFTVDERQRAILFKLGEIIRDDFKPGIHFKMPFINNVKKYDARVLTLDADPERYLTSEKKNLIVDSFVKWKIDDVSTFYTATGGDILVANQRMGQIIKNGLRDEFGKRTIQEVISGERDQIMDILTVQADKSMKELGITVVDVRIKRIDLSQEISDSVYQRMEAERQRVATDLRSRGAESAERIRADADRQRTVLLAEAYRDAESVKGQGDATAAEIYAKAYSKNTEFYSLYRSLNAYKNVFSGQSDFMVLKPDSDFFRYFNSPKHKLK